MERIGSHIKNEPKSARDNLKTDTKLVVSQEQKRKDIKQRLHAYVLF